jgi:chromosome segregation ATPase
MEKGGIWSGMSALAGSQESLEAAKLHLQLLQKDIRLTSDCISEVNSRAMGKRQLLEEMKYQTASEATLKRIELDMSSIDEEKYFLEEMLRKQQQGVAEVESLVSSLMRCRFECESAEREAYHTKEQLDRVAMAREQNMSELQSVSQERENRLQKTMVLEERAQVENERFRPTMLRHNRELFLIKKRLDQVAAVRSETLQSSTDETVVRKLYHRLDDLASMIPQKYREMGDVEVVSDLLDQFSITLEVNDDHILEKLKLQLDEIEVSLKTDKEILETQMQMAEGEVMKMREDVYSLQSRQNHLMAQTQALQEEVNSLSKSHEMAIHTFEKRRSVLEDNVNHLYSLVRNKDPGNHSTFLMPPLLMRSSCRSLRSRSLLPK